MSRRIFFLTSIILSFSFCATLKAGPIDDPNYNLGFELNVVDLVTLGLDLKYSPSINRVVRLLKIGYTTQF